MELLDAKDFLNTVYQLGKKVELMRSDLKSQDPSSWNADRENTCLYREWVNAVLFALKVIESINNPLYRVFLIEKYINRSTTKRTFEYLDYKASGGITRCIRIQAMQAFADSFRKEEIPFFS